MDPSGGRQGVRKGDSAQGCTAGVACAGEAPAPQRKASGVLHKGCGGCREIWGTLGDADFNF